MEFINVLSFFLFENLYILSIVVLLSAFAVSYRSYPLIVYLSILKKITARPNERSSHVKSTPHLGGLGITFGAFFVSAFFGSIILNNDDISVVLAIASSVIILFAAGIKDDTVGLSPHLKLFTEISSVIIFIFLTDIRIDSFHGTMGVYELPTLVSYIFTVFVFVLIINSFNLIDGIDGLASSIAIIILFFLLYYFIYIELKLAILTSSAMIGALLAFLRFNLFGGKKKIFMGDVGSLVVGFTLAYLSVMVLSTSLSEGFEFDNKPVFVLALFAFPFLDTLRVFILRVYNKKNPLKADKSHLHHKLLKDGYSHAQSTTIIVIYSVLTVFLSLLFYQTNINNHLILTTFISVILLIIIFYSFSKLKIKN